MKPNFTNVIFFIPSLSKKKLKGKIHWNKEDSLTLEFENILPRTHLFRPIEVIYAEARNKSKYTLVGCFPSYSLDSHYVFSINETHEGEWIKKAKRKSYTKVDLQITFLTTWYKSVFDIEDSTHSNFWTRVSILKNIKARYQLNNNYSLEITAHGSSSYNKNTITLNSMSTISLLCKKKTSRNMLFQYGVSFLNLFTLFVKAKPIIHKVIFTKTTGEEQKLLMNFKHQSAEDSPTNILVWFKEVEDKFNSILRLYYKKKEKYNEIVERLRGLNYGEPEQTFLTLCRCLELFHKLFVQRPNSSRLIAKLSHSLNRNGVASNPKNGWNQLFRYIHLFESSQHLISLTNINYCIFLNDLKNSRNYYTHPNRTTQRIWGKDELKRVNIKLNAWVRVLLLFNLNLPEEILIRLFKQNSNNYLFLNNESNPFSIFHKYIYKQNSK
jgi:hypothetical protein